MGDKPYHFGLLVGRFQTPHLGHAEMICKAVEICGRVGILVGSAQESGTRVNPFSYAVREELLRRMAGPCVDIAPLNDIGVGNTPEWGDYVMRSALNLFGEMPDLLVSGKEERRAAWFDGAAQNGIAELFIPKSVPVSASQMRGYLISDDQASWRRFTDPKLWAQYGRLRALMLEAQGNDQTDSL